jgi:hypothetical protein
MERGRFRTLVLGILLMATMPAATAQENFAIATPEGLPPIGKWMLTAQSVPSDWLGEIYHGKNLREPITVIIVD